MSASTAAVPAADTNGNHALSVDSHSSQDVRRRTVVAKKIAAPEVLSEGGVNGVSGEKTASKKDVGHAVRGESAVDKPKYSSEARKAAFPSAATAEHRRKSASKQGNAKWETALSVLMKLCLLITAIAWIGQVLWRWQNGDLSFATLDMESRLSKVEGFKKTTKMLQVQLDILDKKLGDEIGKAKMDITKQFEDKGNKLETKMKALEGKTDMLDKSLTELRDMGLVSKKEFDEIVNQVNKKGGLDGTGTEITLDDVRLFAKEIVEMEIARHAADGLGMVDYALGSGGGKVVKHSEPFKKAKGFLPRRSEAHKMLEPSFGQPGECFALEGSSGFVEIKLRTGIIPEAVTIEHVDKSVAYDLSSAPKDFQVSGWYQGLGDDSDKQQPTATNLGEFSYDIEKSNAQTFQLDKTTTDAQIINTVRLDFFSNHGQPDLTCIYRFRVHGSEPGSLGTTASKA
ncbi:SUN domain-containing protein 1-like [Lolium rigidum]|uniref:SUN domain-containing protein 1-like n=1 Tax=Lolium rigidum TaxID=89674 RepID=UPI001F5C1C5F|nr:SUN domain-containing protein 1-like [Lolium rigidum]